MHDHEMGVKVSWSTGDLIHPQVDHGRTGEGPRVTLFQLSVLNTGTYPPRLRRVRPGAEPPPPPRPKTPPPPHQAAWAAPGARARVNHPVAHSSTSAACLPPHSAPPT